MSASSPPKFDVLGVSVHALTLEEAVQRVLAARSGAPLGYVCFCNAHNIVESRDNPGLRFAMNCAFLAAPDGMPLVWLGRLQGNRNMTRVYGPDLMLAVCDAGRGAGASHYFYGGADGVAGELARALAARFHRCRVCRLSG
jgi:N-acetylglucosaminyldiphosphoundecaprenol N-acetyl-beta-D-mannosaminyltransferase